MEGEVKLTGTTSDTQPAENPDTKRPMSSIEKNAGKLPELKKKEKVRQNQPTALVSPVSMNAVLRPNLSDVNPAMGPPTSAPSVNIA